MSGNSERQLNVDLLFRTLGRFRQSVEKLQGLAKVCDRFNVGGMRERALPGLEPVSNGHLVIPRFLIMKGEDFGLVFNQPREVVLQDCRDVCVDLLSFAFEQRVVNRVTQQHMFESETDER